MNIFATYKDPIKCANVLDDLRARKMAIESAQILSTAVHLAHANSICVGEIYKPTHMGHPCVRWALESRANYLWLFQHMEALLMRCSPTHKTRRLSVPLWAYQMLIKNGPRTPHPNCTGDYHQMPVHQAYRECLLEKWARDKRPPTWYAVKLVITNWTDLTDWLKEKGKE